MERGSEQTVQAATEPRCWTVVVIIIIKIKLSLVSEGLPGMCLTLTTIQLVLWYHCSHFLEAKPVHAHHCCKSTAIYIAKGFMVRIQMNIV